MGVLTRAAIVTRLARELQANGSWCGETHIQKAAFLLQELAGVPTDYEFILYKHGPFSFDLRDDLASMRADDLLELVPQPAPYGPKLIPTDHSSENEDAFPKTLGKYEEKFDCRRWNSSETGICVKNAAEFNPLCANEFRNNHNSSFRVR